MHAGAAKTDITPAGEVWMDGMIRSGKSRGVHDRIFARALVLSANGSVHNAAVIISVEVCGLAADFTNMVRTRIREKTGILAERIIIAATHTHSGPASLGIFNPIESEYLDALSKKLPAIAHEAVGRLVPAHIGCASGRENTISHYRRLMGKNGRVVMNWEPYHPEDIIGPLGVPDDEVGVLYVVDSQDSARVICTLFNHAGHPNVMSGDNYLISGDYAGFAMRTIEDVLGGVSLFVNGAQGTMDIDGLKDRDWQGVERAGKALADSVLKTIREIQPHSEGKMRTGFTEYTLPPRIITPAELEWADAILAKTGGAIAAMADGVGDDYKAALFKRLHTLEDQQIPVQQICIAIDNTAFINFPGELFTEIGMEIKTRSPFEKTYIMGLANGEIGYVPTKKAIGEGGYAVETRGVSDKAEEIVLGKSLALLEEIYAK